MAGPFYFAWADFDEFEFGPEHLVEDEIIESFELEEEENDFPLLKIKVKNPRIGPLHSSRQTHCWFALDVTGEGYIEPLFFGELTAVPTEITGDLVEFIFRAIPEDVFEQKARIADELREPPFYHDLGLDISERDDPDKVLEGRAALWHVDRVTHEVSITSITQGEDGTEIFGEDEVPADSVNSDLSQTPLHSVGVDARVTWRQKTRGVVDLGAHTFVSYSGDGIIADWPKPGQNLGGGWTCLSGVALDANGVQSAISASWSFNWQNKSKKHHNGDTMSISISETAPSPDTGIKGQLTLETQTGVLDPYAKDEKGDPKPVNIPPHVRASYMHILQWQVRAGLIAQYEADRERSERIMFVVGADLQPMIGDTTDPNAGSETIAVNDADAGAPIVRLRSWFNVRSTVVSIGDVVFPMYEGFPGLRVGQIAVVGGLTGEDEPEFSPIVGDVTIDGAAQWASLGPVDPNTAPQNWPKETDVAVGTVILPEPDGVVLEYKHLIMPGQVQFPVAGVSVNEGQIIRGNNGSYHICKLSGTTEPRGQNVGIEITPTYKGQFFFNLPTITQDEPQWPTTWGVDTVDGSVTWFSLGTTLPDGQHYHICTQAGQTGEFPPPFANTVGGVTNDGAAKWTNMVLVQVPVGGAVNDVRRSSFFPTDLGKNYLEYLLCLARAKLLHAARAVKVKFDCKIERAVYLSCRKNAHLTCRHIPGGSAFGKITKYTMRGNSSGEMRGTITIGCTVGKGNSVVLSAGEPTYAQNGYMQTGYQQMENRTIALPSVGDVGYSPPLSKVIDDGLVFPLTKTDAIERETFHGSLEDQVDGLDIAIQAAQQAAVLNRVQPANRQQSIDQQRSAQLLGTISVDRILKDNPIWYELQLRPVTGTSYASLYSIETVPLVAPKHINLEAAS